MGLVIAAAVAGAGVWYTQNYAFYHDVTAETVALTTLAGVLEPVPVRDFRGTDAESSPIRYRACFTVDLSLAALSEEFEIAEAPTPLVGPGWFDCYDARMIDEALAAGEAVAFLGEKNVAYGVDRIVAVDREGRAWAWNQLNNCGETAYDGSPTSEACPERPAEGSE